MEVRLICTHDSEYSIHPRAQHRNRLDREALWDAIREQNAAWSSAYSLSLSIPLHRGITGANVFRHSHRDPSTLGGIPLVCGDSINADSDDESARIAVTEFLVDNIGSAPILSAYRLPCFIHSFAIS